MGSFSPCDPLRCSPSSFNTPIHQLRITDALKGRNGRGNNRSARSNRFHSLCNFEQKVWHLKLSSTEQRDRATAAKLKKGAHAQTEHVPLTDGIVLLSKYKIEMSKSRLSLWRENFEFHVEALPTFRTVFGITLWIIYELVQIYDWERMVRRWRKK